MDNKHTSKLICSGDGIPRPTKFEWDIRTSHWLPVNATILNDTVVIDRRFFDDEITIMCSAVNPHGKITVKKKLQPLVISVLSKISMIVLIFGVIGIFGFGFALGIYWPNKHEIAFMSGEENGGGIDGKGGEDCALAKMRVCQKSESQMPLTGGSTGLESYDVTLDSNVDKNDGNDDDDGKVELPDLDYSASTILQENI